MNLDRRFGHAKAVHPHAWLWEPLEREPSFVLRTMFGAKAVYVDGKLWFCFVVRRQEPWRGMLVCTERAHHDSLRQEFPVLSPHPILPKWLYLPECADAFEDCAQRLVSRAVARDARLGIVPPARQARRARVRAGKSSSR